MDTTSHFMRVGRFNSQLNSSSGIFVVSSSSYERVMPNMPS